MGFSLCDMVFYLLFAIIIIPFQFFSDIYIHGAVENFYGFKIYDYLVYTRYRFLQRSLTCGVHKHWPRAKALRHRRICVAPLALALSD